MPLPRQRGVSKRMEFFQDHHFHENGNAAKIERSYDATGIFLLGFFYLKHFILNLHAL